MYECFLFHLLIVNYILLEGCLKYSPFVCIHTTLDVLLFSLVYCQICRNLLALIITEIKTKKCMIFTNSLKALF